MSATAEDVSKGTRRARRDAPTPSQGGQGSDLRSVANDIEGLLDDDGHFNPNPDQLSRGHPDYDESADSRAGGQDRDEKTGRFKAKSSPSDDEGDDANVDDNLEQETDEGEDVDVSDEDTDVDDDTGDTDEELDESAVDDTDDDSEETDGVQTVAEMAEALEMSVDDFLGAVSHTFNAAGEDVTVTLADAIKGYQKDADYRRGTANLAEAKRAHEQEYSASMEKFQSHNQQLAAQLSAMEQVIVSQLESPAMKELRSRDPAEWTARREELGQQVNFIHQQRQQAAQQFDAMQNDYLQGLKTRSMEALKEAVPDFGSKHGETAKEVLGSLGFGQEEISKIFDHRVVVGALELDRLRKENAELKASKDKAIAAAKKVKKTVPKLTKPGKSRSGNKTRVKRDNLAHLKGNLRKSGSVGDAAKVIEQMI